MGLVLPKVHRLHRRLCGWVRWFYSVQGPEANFALLISHRSASFCFHSFTHSRSQSSVPAYDFLLCFLCAFARFDEWLSLEKEAKAHFISLYIFAIGPYFYIPLPTLILLVIFVFSSELVGCDIQEEAQTLAYVSRYVISGKNV